MLMYCQFFKLNKVTAIKEHGFALPKPVPAAGNQKP